MDVEDLLNELYDERFRDQPSAPDEAEKGVVVIPNARVIIAEDLVIVIRRAWAAARQVLVEDPKPTDAWPPVAGPPRATAAPDQPFDWRRFFGFLVPEFPASSRLVPALPGIPNSLSGYRDPS